jgi:hypothetical protein
MKESAIFIGVAWGLATFVFAAASLAATSAGVNLVTNGIGGGVFSAGSWGALFDSLEFLCISAKAAHGFLAVRPNLFLDGILSNASGLHISFYPASCLECMSSK